MASTVQIKVMVSLAWWWPLYMHGLVFFCMLMQAEPNAEKVERVIKRALRTRVLVA